MVKSTPKSIEYGVYLDCGGEGSFGRENSKVTAGAEKVFQDTEIIVMNTTAQTIDDVRTRERPTAESRVVTYVQEPHFRGPDDPGGPKSYVPKGFGIESIRARTKKKYAVGKWNNHWYYGAANASTEPGWMYGEFLRVR